jgi:hypothetical protein
MGTIRHLPINEQAALYHQGDALISKEEASEKPKNTPPNRLEHQ